MEDTTLLIIFGSEPHAIVPELTQLFGRSDDPILNSFWERSYRGLRAEVGISSRLSTEELPLFSSVTDLCALFRQNKLHPALCQALVCIHHLASFISYCRDKHAYHPPSLRTYTIGYGIGAISAAAISTSQNALELLPTAVEAVRVAFRAGLIAANVSKCLDPRSRYLAAWSVHVPQLGTIEKASEVVQEFLDNNISLTSSKVYISSVSDRGVNISGVPRLLSQLGSSRAFEGFEIQQAAIFAPYHAPHLYSEADVDLILGPYSTTRAPTNSRHITRISAATGRLSWSGSFRTALQEVLRELLLAPVRKDVLRLSLPEILQSSRGNKIVLLHFGSSQDIEIFDTLRKEEFNVLNVGHTKATVLAPMPSEGTTAPCIADIHADSNTVDESAPMSRSKIAVIGMSGRFPDASNMASFWNLLYNGCDVHKVVPPSRWDAVTHVESSGKLTSKNTSGTPYGCWLDDAAEFDAKFFHLSPREAPQVDPAQRIGLLTSYEALESAGVVPGATPSTQKDRIGVFYGVTSNDWMETNSAQNIDTYMIPGGNRAFIPGRINFYFKFSGPSLSIDTACSSSLASINVACSSLWKGDIDMAVAGGTNVLTNPDFTAGLDRGHFLSRTGNCKTFDDTADGYCRGEGVCTVILKRLDDAIVDNDPIHALIISAHTNHSADAESITRPYGGAQKAIFNKLLNDTSLDPLQVSFVEMHGTGTQAGDAEEMRSVLDVFAPSPSSNSALSRSIDNPLWLGSVKANIGHGEAASGVSGLAKVLLMMKHNVIPPHCGIKTRINHKFPADLTDRNVHIADKPICWDRADGIPRRVLLNNFSAAGGNSALLIEDAPLSVVARTKKDIRGFYCIAVSAKCATSLQGNVRSLLGHISQGAAVELSLPALSYTTTARRVHYAHRLTVQGSDIDRVKSELQVALEQIGEKAMHSRRAPQVVFTFTGQGSSYVSMGRQFYESISSFKSHVDKLDHLSQSLGYPSFLPPIRSAQGNMDDYSPLIAQLATSCLEIALTRLWESWGIFPHAVIGHSLGQYAALNAAGVLSDFDAVFLVGRRAELLERRCTPSTHAMLAVRASSSTIENLISEHHCEIVCFNGPSDVVLGGENRVITEIQLLLTASGLRTRMLRVPYAFHSSQVDPILDELKNAAERVVFNKPEIPVVCPTTGGVIKPGDPLASLFVTRHCREPVDMVKAVEAAKSSGILGQGIKLIEIGPAPVVSRMINSASGLSLEILPTLQQNESSWELVTNALCTLYMSGADIAWSEFHRDFPSCHQVLQLPSYSWDLKPYWIQYVHDWSLRKGDSLPLTAELRSKEPTQQANLPKLESTTVHRIVEERFDQKGGKIIVEADISRSDLSPLIQGHSVSGVPLCTPSVYADIALSIGTYALDRHGIHTDDRLVNVSQMAIEKALIAQPHRPQILRATVVIDWDRYNAACRFESYTIASKVPTGHSSCVIAFESASEQYSKLSCRTSTTKESISTLQKAVAEGRAYRFNKSMIYKMISGLAQFDPNYMALDQIILDSSALEASGVVSFTSVNSTGSFHTHPAYIDALSQLAGFAMNANDKANLSEKVFVNHGWRDFRLFERISYSKTYGTYVKMQEAPGKTYVGNVFVFEQDRAVAIFEDIVLQGVGRRALEHILKRESGLSHQGHGAQKLSHEVRIPLEVNAPPLSLPQRGISRLDKELVVETSINDALVAPSLEAYGPSLSSELALLTEPEITQSALKIIAEESGLAVSDLADDSLLTDLGIDSLLILIISSRFKEELRVDFDSTALALASSITDVKVLLNPTETVVTASIEARTPKLAPTIDVKVQSYLDMQRPPEPRVLLTDHKPNTIFRSPKESAKLADFIRALQIISEESGVDVAELNDDVVLSDIGIDSLLSLVILDRLRDELMLDVGSSASIFTDFPTIRDLKRHFKEEYYHVAEESNLVAQVVPGISTTFAKPTGLPTPLPGDTIVASVTAPKKLPPPVDVESASSIVLQGRPRSLTPTLFLFPDGGGSAFSYSSLPTFDPPLAIIGLNCPYARTPELMTCTLPQLLSSYLSEIRRRQPIGPYTLGGWSSGGILAYAATQRLIQEAEVVDRLILIDAPVPQGLDRLPESWYKFCTETDLLGSHRSAPQPQLQQQVLGHGNNERQRVVPKWLVPHFKATIEVLHDYFATPLPEGLAPQTTIVWAAESALEGVRLPRENNDTKGIKFLTEKRTDFSAGGWGRLFPGEDVEVHVIKGANHFSIMGEYVLKLATILRKAIL